jgi:environmental stress-induced protein Ves
LPVNGMEEPCMRASRFLTLAARLMMLAPLACAADDGRFSPYAGPSRPLRVFWGDTHLHSALSTDAFGFGVRLGPEEAFRFASGQEVASTHGLAARLQRPLDFVVLADHA